MTTQVHPTGSHAARSDALDLREMGAPINGVPQVSQRRLFMQLQVFTGCADPEPVKRAMMEQGAEGVLYLDITDPQGIGVLLISEDPLWFTGPGRSLLTRGPFGPLRRRAELTMLGRTYASGREQQLEDWLLRKPRRTVLNPQWPWAVWYPLRRKSEFALLAAEEQSRILGEHARIGMAFGQAGYASDVRLACYGLDASDNEFVLGLIGPELYYLSALVQEMRKSQQTARYIQSLGPFFIGRAHWQSPQSEQHSATRA